MFVLLLFCCNLTCRVRVVFFFFFFSLNWCVHYSFVKMQFLVIFMHQGLDICHVKQDQVHQLHAVILMRKWNALGSGNQTKAHRTIEITLPLYIVLPNPYHLMLHGSFEKVHVHAWLYGPRVFSWLCIAIYVQDLYTEVVGIMDFVPFLLPYSLQVISNVGLKMIIYLIYLFF